MRFDLTDLRLFLYVAEAGSITAGAERACLALASASARIRGMEQLGVPLLVRGRHGARPTAAGATLCHHARVVLGQVERMRGELGEYAHGLKGQVHLLCNTAALTEFLPDVLGRFMTAHPHIGIDVEERQSAAIVKAIRDGQADVGIVADVVDLAGLETYPFRTDRLVAIMAAGHPLQAQGRRRSIAFADLLDQPFIGLAGDSALQRYLGEQAARAGHTLLPRIRLRSFDAICRVVAGGAGIAVVPATAARAGRRLKGLRCVPLADAWAVRELTICLRHLADLPLHAQRLVGALQTA